MSCPTCDHTMGNIAHVYACPRCGTIRWSNGSYTVPSIVERALSLCEAVDATHYPASMPLPQTVYTRVRNLRECCEVNATDPNAPIREEIHWMEDEGAGR